MLPLSEYVCLSLLVKYWPICGYICGCHSHSKLALFVVPLFSSFHHPSHPSHHPHPSHLPHIYYYIHWPKIDVFLDQKVMKISHYLFAGLLVQKLTIILLSKCSQYQAEAGFEYLKWYFLKYWQAQTRVIFKLQYKFECGI